MNWTRTQSYAADSNRLATSVDSNGTFNATHDAHGNLLAMPGLNVMQWDAFGNLHATTPYSAGSQRTFYTYDASGNRVRKVTETNASSTWIRSADTLYLGGFELVRTWTGSAGTALGNEIETLHVMDADARLAIVETQTVEAGAPPPTPITPKWRYQLDDLIGSSAVELGRDGQVISYEEFHPYGTTALLIDTGGEGFRKRYRWSGKERDAESGLVYFGARYFAPWLGRWASADPAGAVDGNPYRVVRGNPVGLREVDGRQSWFSLANSTVQSAMADAGALESRGPARNYSGAPDRPASPPGAAPQPAASWGRAPVSRSTPRVDSSGRPVHTGDRVAAVNSAGESNAAGGETTVGTRIAGVARVAGGVAEIGIAVGAGTAAPPSAPLAIALGAHGADQVQAGLRQAWTGQTTQGLTESAVSGGLQSVGVSEERADFAGAVVDAVAGVGLSLAGVARAAAPKAVTESLAARAAEVHDALDPIAQAQRTTAVLRTNAGDIVAGGARDLTPAQRAMLRPGEVPARLPGAHAEVTALRRAIEEGASPEAMAVTRTICPLCVEAIEERGRILTSRTTAMWPRAR